MSSLTITIVYAVYAAGTVTSLLLVGTCRIYGWTFRPDSWLIVAIVVAVLFIPGSRWLASFVARLLTGTALGVTVATATAYLSDLDTGPQGVATRRSGIVATIANNGGLAIGRSRGCWPGTSLMG